MGFLDWLKKGNKEKEAEPRLSADTKLVAAKAVDTALKSISSPDPKAEKAALKSISSPAPQAILQEPVLNLGWYWSENKSEHQMAKIKEKDRATHLYVIGASGAGKSKFLEFLIRQDISNRKGFGVIDPHGDLIEEIKGYLLFTFSKEEIEQRVVYVDPASVEYTIAFNPLEKTEGITPAETAAELIEAFKKIWFDSWGARMEDLLRNTLIALIEANLTLVDLPQFLINENFRFNTIKHVKHPITKVYFERFNKLQSRIRDEWAESTLNKVNAFLTDDRIREMFAFKKSSINLREIMDNSQILLLKLDRGRLKENADLIGSLFMTKLKLAAFSRSSIPKEQRAQFYLYIDEFQNFATKTFIELLSESRKYGLSLILAHQNLTQLPEDLQDSILTNCGIQVSFRASRKDAERIAKEFFQTTGKEIKESKFSPTAAIDHKFYSYQEEWEYYFQAIQTLPPRCFFVKHKIEGGILPLKTDTIAPAFELAGVSQDKHKEALQNSHFGLKYLSPRGKPQLQLTPIESGLDKPEETDTQPEITQEKPKPQKKFKPKEKASQEEVSQTETKSTILEEITATLTPLEKAILWSIGIGNYQAEKIYEEANKKLKSLGETSINNYSELKNEFYTLAKHPPEGKGLIEFSKRGKGLCYWLSPWGETAFSEKFSLPSDRAINELGGGGKLGKAVSLEIIKEWLEPEGYIVKKEDQIETGLNESERGYTDLIAEKDGEILRIEIENRTDKDQIEKNIRKNLEYTNILYEIASDQTAKNKLIQVALKTMFRLRKEKPDDYLMVKIATIDELKQSNFKEWFEATNR